MRHAHATAGYSDFDRPLSRIGEEECRKVGGLFVGVREPLLILSSTAKRCIQTLELITAISNYDLIDSCEFLDELYLASASKILHVLKARNSQVNILIVGHNPGMSEILSIVISGKNAFQETQILPTCGIFVCDYLNSSDSSKGLELNFKDQYFPE